MVRATRATDLLMPWSGAYLTQSAFRKVHCLGGVRFCAAVGGLHGRGHDDGVSGS